MTKIALAAFFDPASGSLIADDARTKELGVWIHTPGVPSNSQSYSHRVLTQYASWTSADFSDLPEDAIIMVNKFTCGVGDPSGQTYVNQCYSYDESGPISTSATRDSLLNYVVTASPPVIQ